MKIQADSYNIIKDIGDRKSSSKNKNIKNNKFEDNLYKATDHKKVKNRREVSKILAQINRKIVIMSVI